MLRRTARTAQRICRTRPPGCQSPTGPSTTLRWPRPSLPSYCSASSRRRCLPRSRPSCRPPPNSRSSPSLPSVAAGASKLACEDSVHPSVLSCALRESQMHTGLIFNFKRYSLRKGAYCMGAPLQQSGWCAARERLAAFWRQPCSSTLPRRTSQGCLS